MRRLTTALLLNLAFVLSAAGCSATTRLASEERRPPRAPNIVFILADDLGWTDLGCMGSKYYETPNIDRLAAEGITFTNHHSAQNCTPTRAALMSGQYPTRTGVYTVGSLVRGTPESRRFDPPQNETDLPLDRLTIAQQLKAAGYATAMFGKWHIGENGPHHPSRRGFDEAIVSAGVHFNFRTNPRTDYPSGTYLADFLTDKAVEFIQRHKDRPFFLYLPHFAVHSPHQAKQQWIDHFKAKRPAGGHNNPVYAAMIASIDESVGRILATLDELGLSDNTLIIFSSDNGGTPTTENAPLRGFKGMQYEGGLRVPLIARWPGVTLAGKRCSEPTVHVDLYPTLLAAASAPQPPQTLDGHSLVPLLRNPAARLPRQAIYFHLPGYLEGRGQQWRSTPTSTIIAGRWKLLEFLEYGRTELYDLQADLGETRDLSEQHPSKAAELLSMLHAWREQTGAAMPAPNPRYRHSTATASP